MIFFFLKFDYLDIWSFHFGKYENKYRNLFVNADGNF